MKFCTEGVLILASARKLQEEYEHVPFDYSFPYGLSRLLEQNAIIAITTTDGEDVALEILNDGEKLTGDFDKVITQWIELRSNDEILILSHAEFTSICSKKGDYLAYGWPVKKITGKEEGVYKVKIGVDDFRSNFSEIQSADDINSRS
jgi:hypothetical protein